MLGHDDAAQDELVQQARAQIIRDRPDRIGLSERGDRVVGLERACQFRRNSARLTLLRGGRRHYPQNRRHLLR